MVDYDFITDFGFMTGLYISLGGGGASLFNSFKSQFTPDELLNILLISLPLYLISGNVELSRKNVR
jgi:hypothetical protein